MFKAFSNLLISIFLMFAALVFVNPARAGGGPVEFSVEPNTSLNPGEQYIIRARVYAEGPYPTYCKNCLIHLKFKDPQEGDYIAQNSDRTDENGTVYAKVISKVPGGRVIYPTDLQTAEGKLIESGNYVTLNYSGDSSLPKTPIINFYAQVNDQKYVGGPKRIVTVGWNYVPNIERVNVYARLADSQDWGEAISSSTMLYPRSAQISINAFLDYNIKVDACKGSYPCLSSEIFLPAMKQDQNKDVPPQPKYPYVPQNLRITQIETTKDPGVRNVHLMWDPVEGATSYNIYSSTKAKAPSITANVDTNLYEIKIPTDLYTDVRVTAKNGELESKNSKVISLYVNSDGSKNPPPQLNPSPSVISTPQADNGKVEELNKKVQNLQYQLDQSVKKQNILEQRITELVNWIKSVFPFFK
jgi:hypothetical protein